MIIFRIPSTLAIALSVLWFIESAGQTDTTVFRKAILKINDSLVREDIFVFRPEMELYPVWQLSNYYEKGMLIEETVLVGGKSNGLRKKYYRSGALKELSNFVMGSMAGLYCEFYQNGGVKAVGEYMLNFNDSIVVLVPPEVIADTTITPDGVQIITKTIGYDQGMKNGKWLYYNENGKLLRQEVWDLGALKAQGD